MELEPIIINKNFYPIPEDLDALKELEKLMTDINQPINSKLSSLLQVLCATSNKPKMVEYLLKQKDITVYEETLAVEILKDSLVKAKKKSNSEIIDGLLKKL